MTAADIENLKARVTVADVLRDRGIQVCARRCRCPVHGGDNPKSLSLSRDARLWHCHACGAGGDVVALAMALGGCTFGEAVDYLAGLAGMPARRRTTRIDAWRARRTTSEHETRRLDLEREDAVWLDRWSDAVAWSDVAREAARITARMSGQMSTNVTATDNVAEALRLEREADRRVAQVDLAWRRWRTEHTHAPRYLCLRDLGIDPVTLEPLPLDLSAVHPAIREEIFGDQEREVCDARDRRGHG